LTRLENWLAISGIENKGMKAGISPGKNNGGVSPNVFR
jgi:hypothetical protein